MRYPANYVLRDSLARRAHVDIYRGHVKFASGDKHEVFFKRLTAQGARDHAALRCFDEERRIHGMLGHPNVPELLDTGLIGGRPFYAAAWVSGGNLADALRVIDALSPSERLRFAAQLARDACSVIASLAELGVAHRDIDPSNILLGTDGLVRITDFGIAVRQDRSWQTTEGVVQGKDEYIAPEEFRGEPPSSAADIYALGVVLYRILSGHLPLGTWERRVAFVRGEDVVEPLKSDIGLCVTTMLASDPAERPSPASVCAAFTNSQPDPDVVRRAASAPARGGVWSAFRLPQTLRRYEHFPGKPAQLT